MLYQPKKDGQNKILCYSGLINVIYGAVILNMCIPSVECSKKKRHMFFDINENVSEKLNVQKMWIKAEYFAR